MHKPGPSYDLPRDYEPTGFWRYLMAGLGTIALICGGLGLWRSVTGNGLQNSGRMTLFLVCGTFMLIGLGLIAYAGSMRVMLRQDEIELRSIFSSQTMRRDDVLGYRTIQADGPPVIVLVPRWDDRKKLKIPNLFRFDAAFNEWLSKFPNLDEKDEKEAAEELENNQALGPNKAERIAAAKQARLVCRTLTIATFAIAVWAWVYPEPYPLVILLLVALPWTAVYVASRYRGAVVINQKKNDPHPGVTIPILVPGLVLALVVLNDIHPLLWKSALVMSLIVSVVLIFTALQVDYALQKQKAAAVLLFLFFIAYGYGVTMQANASFDRGRPQVYEPQIAKKYVSSGKSTTYHLLLTPWGPHETYDNVTVSRSFYNAQRVGNPVCVVLRPGALSIPWYVVRSCR